MYLAGLGAVGTNNVYCGRRVTRTLILIIQNKITLYDMRGRPEVLTKQNAFQSMNLITTTTQM